MAGRKRQFGNVRRLPSKRWQAFYRHGTDVRHTAPSTFETKLDAEAWLVDERRLIASGAWFPPKSRHSRADEPVTLGDYAQTWVGDRRLKPRTREHYGKLLSSHLAPLAGQQLTQLTAAAVRRWHADLDSSTPTYSAHAYSLLRAILTTAVDDGEIPANPCHIRGAGSTKRAKKIHPATLDELEVITREMPPKYQPMILLAVWCALRFGEMIELRRRDVDLTVGVIRVRRGAARADGQVIIDTPKSDAGVRDVAIPPHLIPLLRDHLQGQVQAGKDGLLFPAADGRSTLAPSTFYGKASTTVSRRGATRVRAGHGFYGARETAGRPDLRLHDLRHTGAVLAAQAGATLPELMGRLGHSTPQAALIYQHAAQGRDAHIAATLSKMVEHRS